MIEDYSYEYWKMLLEDADNASSDNNRIIYALVDAFGKDVVFSKKPFISTDTINYKIFDILNEHMFDSSLKRIKILYMTASEITAYMNVEFERQNVEDKANIEHYKDSIGIYSCTMDYDHSLPEPRCYETLYFTENEEMFINKDVLSTKSFMFTVATICHEMIHYYDRLNGDEYL